MPLTWLTKLYNIQGEYNGRSKEKDLEDQT